MDNPVWHRQPGEPIKWYDRFQAYLTAGPARTIHGTYTAEWQEKTRTPARKTPGAWTRVAQQWQWSDRADAYDARQQEIAIAAVDDAMLALRLAGPRAARRLVQLLDAESDEQARQAANSILNRIGAIHVPQADDDGRVPITTIEVINPKSAAGDAAHAGADG